MEVTFYSHSEDNRLRFAVIAWPGAGTVGCSAGTGSGRLMSSREAIGNRGRASQEAARRELLEETGAEVLVLEPVCAYSVTGKNRVSRKVRKPLVCSFMRR